MKAINFVGYLLVSWTCLAALLVPSAMALKAQPLAYLAYGDWRGHIEPCGCDPATDLGGIKRLGGFLARERAISPQLLVVSLGNTLPSAADLSRSEQARIKADFLLEAEAANAPHAVLLNATEFQSLDVLQTFAKTRPHLRAKIPYVLSNMKPRATLSVPYQASIKEGDTIVFAYFFQPEMAAKLQKVDQALLKRLQKAKADARAGHTILLFSGSNADLKLFAEANIFDEIISSNAKSLQTEPGTDEKDDESKLIRLGQPLVRMVPLGVQGVLRGGMAQVKEAKPLAEYLSNNTTEVSPRGSGASTDDSATRLKFAAMGKGVSWLDNRQASSKELDIIYDRYSEATKKSFAQRNIERAKQLKNSPYAGAQACQTCHSAAYQTWQTSRHAQAMETLIHKQKQQDMECVVCHSVGANANGGFVSMEDSPHLANVQCEACHDARAGHTKDPMKHRSSVKAKVPETCVQCHNSQHSPAFDATSYWQKIKHGKG